MPSQWMAAMETAIIPEAGDEHEPGELFVGVGGELELVLVLLERDDHGDGGREHVGVGGEELGAPVHPEGNEDGRTDEDGDVDERE